MFVFSCRAKEQQVCSTILQGGTRVKGMGETGRVSLVSLKSTFQRSNKGEERALGLSNCFGLDSRLIKMGKATNANYRHIRQSR
jgi:hypothetical protein